MAAGRVIIISPLLVARLSFNVGVPEGVDTGEMFPYIHNADWVGNPARMRSIPGGGPFGGPGLRGHRLPRPWASKQPPEMDTACEDFLTSLYCFYFTP